MNYKIILIIALGFFLFSCEKNVNNFSKIDNSIFEKKYNNSGFALIYNENLKDIKKLDTRSLNIYNKSLKKR